MIPPLQSPFWTQVVTGKKPLKSSKLAINLMAKSIQVSYQRDPSPANVAALVARAHEFFVQYESAFANELKQMLA